MQLAVSRLRFSSGVLLASSLFAPLAVIAALPPQLIAVGGEISGCAVAGALTMCGFITGQVEIAAIGIFAASQACK